MNLCTVFSTPGLLESRYVGPENDENVVVKIQDASLECSNKVIVTVAIEGGKSLDTERLEFQMPCVGRCVSLNCIDRDKHMPVSSKYHFCFLVCSSECPCPCNYASDVGCDCHDLQEKIVLNLAKTPVFATYPLTYIQSFNGRPKEVVTTGISKCKARLPHSLACSW